MAKFILDTRLSAAHYVILKEAIARGIIEPHDLNEGRRTMAEQTVFWLRWLRERRIPAAFPSPNAPHIWRGRANHAIDVQVARVQALASFYMSLGVPVRLNTVRGEPWHVVFPDEAALLRAAESLRERGGHLVTLKPLMRHQDVRSLRFKLWDAGVGGVSAKSNKAFYGRSLVKKVKRFQYANGLKADGIVGPATWKKLREKGGRR